LLNSEFRKEGRGMEKNSSVGRKEIHEGKRLK
jgi:hypothetical protein